MSSDRCCCFLNWTGSHQILMMEICYAILLNTNSIRAWATCLVPSMATRCLQIRWRQLLNYNFACACSTLFLFQELLAQGVSNLLGSFMSCLPMSGSLSRSLVQVTLLGIENSNSKTYLQESSGCKSLLTGLTSAIFLLGVLLFLGPIFQVWWVESCHK